MFVPHLFITERLCPQSSRRLLETENLGSQAVSDGSLGYEGKVAHLDILDWGLKPVVNPPRPISGGPSFLLSLANLRQSLSRGGIRASPSGPDLGLQGPYLLVFGLKLAPHPVVLLFKVLLRGH